MAKWKHLSYVVVALFLLVSFNSYAADRWVQLAPGVRWLHRITRHADGAPLDMQLVYVDLCDPHVRFRVSTPNEMRRRVSRWGASVGALVAVNGDYFDPRTHVPLGPTRGAGRDWPRRNDYVFGTLLGFRRGALPEIFPRWPVANAVTDVLPSREHIVQNGRVQLDPSIPHPGHRHPRTGLGITRDGRTLFVVEVDGRSGRSAGVSTLEYANLLVSLGAWQGLKLDGGGSSAVWIAGHGVVNRPSDGFERSVGNHLGILYDHATTDAAPAACTASTL